MRRRPGRGFGGAVVLRRPARPPSRRRRAARPPAAAPRPRRSCAAGRRALLLHRARDRRRRRSRSRPACRGRRLGVGDVGVVERASCRLAARRRQPVLERLAVLPQQEAVLQADVDVVPGQPRGHRAGAEVAPTSTSMRRRLGDRALPALEREALVPAVEAAPAPTPPRSRRPTRRSPRDKMPSTCDAGSRAS